MTRARFAFVLTLVAFCGIAFHAQTPAPETAYRFQPVVPGVYSAIGTGTLNVGSNSAVIVNQDDVLIVDSHISPESARVMLQEMKLHTIPVWPRAPRPVQRFRSGSSVRWRSTR